MSSWQDRLSCQVDFIKNRCRLGASRLHNKCREIQDCGHNMFSVVDNLIAIRSRPRYQQNSIISVVHSILDQRYLQ